MVIVVTYHCALHFKGFLECPRLIQDLSTIGSGEKGILSSNGDKTVKIKVGIPESDGLEESCGF